MFALDACWKNSSFSSLALMFWTPHHVSFSRYIYFWPFLVLPNTTGSYFSLGRAVLSSSARVQHVSTLVCLVSFPFLKANILFFLPQIQDMVAIRHTASNEQQRTTMILLCEDGSLRIYMANVDNTSYWLQPSLQPSCGISIMKPVRKRKAAATSEFEWNLW